MGGHAKDSTVMDGDGDADHARAGGTVRFAKGQIIGGAYTIERVLGAGGMGTVYEAIETTTGGRVALKTLNPEYAADPETVRRFKNEVNAARNIKHPNVISIYTFGYEGRQPYFVMEYLPDGETLAERLQKGPLSPAEVLKFFGEALEALEAAHQKGIVHRDLKPDNLWVARAGGTEFIKILDFGIAMLRSETSPGALTRTGQQLGTPLYMSPEQCKGVGVDHRTDIYAIGCILFVAFTGRTPFEAPTVPALFARILTEPPLWPSDVAKVSPALEALILRCLAKDPAERPQSALELKQALRRALEPVPDPPPVKQRPLWPLWAVGLLALAGLGFYALGRGSGDDTRAVSSPAPGAALVTAGPVSTARVASTNPVPSLGSPRIASNVAPSQVDVAVVVPVNGPRPERGVLPAGKPATRVQSPERPQQHLGASPGNGQESTRAIESPPPEPAPDSTDPPASPAALPGGSEFKRR